MRRGPAANPRMHEHSDASGDAAEFGGVGDLGDGEREGGVAHRDVVTFGFGADGAKGGLHARRQALLDVGFLPADLLKVLHLSLIHI